MVAGWLVVPSGLLMLALSAWYGVSQYSASNAPSLPPATARCECALPASLRVVRMLHHVFPPPIQHRMGGADDVPDLSQLSTAELQGLLGLPEDLIPTEQEIAELQALLAENGVPLSVLMQAGQQNQAHEEELSAGPTADDTHAAEDPHPVMDDYVDDPHAAGPPPADPHAADPFDAPPPPPDPFEAAAPPPPEPFDSHGAAAPAAPPPPPPPNPGPPPSMAAGSFGVPFSQSAMDAAHDVFQGANVPIAAVSNPFPQNPFPADYADYGQQFLGPAAFPLSPTSYYHPVRTFKFRLFVPTFREFFGFQFASQTIVEIYVAKKPGANQFTGIPDAFFEKKYWNILFEVDGNKVISTMPTVLANQPLARTSSGNEDIVAETTYNQAAERYEPQSDGGGAHDDPNEYEYDTDGSESAGYDYQQDGNGQESSDYGYDSDGYGQDSDGYGQDSDGYGQDSEDYGYVSDGYGQGSDRYEHGSSDGYESESDGSEYGSDAYGNEWDQYSDGQLSRRSNMPDAFRRKTNQTRANAHRRGQTHASSHSSATYNRRAGTRGGVNRMGTAAAATRRTPARPKKPTSSMSKRRPPQTSRRRTPYGPTAQVPTRNRQSPAKLKRRTQPSSRRSSKRRAASKPPQRSAPGRTRRRRPTAASPARHTKPAPTPPGWRPPAATSYRSKWPERASADYEDSELRREAHRNQLKYKAKHGYMRRMTPERYTAWERA